MRWLTYADREFLLQTFHDLCGNWKGSDAELLMRLSEWSKSLTPDFGFEHTLIQDAVALSRYLHTHSGNQDVADIARGAIRYILSAGKLHSSKLGDFGLLDEACIGSYALHEIRSRLGEPATYNPPHLTREEQYRAESLFLHFIDEPFLPDEHLIREANAFSERLGNFVASCLFGRLKKNVEFLSSVLVDASRPDEHRAYARAALAYVACQADAIDDGFGLVGYLDDYFIAQMAVDFLEPARNPWLELLDATVNTWPFLNQLLLEWEGHVAVPSEYQLLNAAVSCAELRKDGIGSVMLIAPRLGPTSFLLGVITTLGLIQRTKQQETKENFFHPGQKVLVDYSAVREFAGFFEMKDGRKMFGLRRHRIQQNEPMKEIDYWPMSDLWRLVPAPVSRSLRGQLTHLLSRNDAELPGLAYVFNEGKLIQLSSIEKQILVVTPVPSAHEMAKRLRLFGHELKDVVPMGQVTTSQEVKPWSNRFGQQEPLLLFVSDLDLACSFIEERQERCHSVIVDATGRNARKTASLRQLQHSSVPTVILTAERVADQLTPEKEDNVSIWEWDEEDFSALLWPPLTDKDNANPIVRYESLLQTRRADSIETISLSFPPARRAFDAVRQLRILARQRGEDHLTELDNIVSLSFWLLSWLLRLATPLTGDMASTGQITNHFQELDALRKRSRYLSEIEQLATKDAADALRQIFFSLRSENKKAESISQLLLAQPQLSIVCPDTRLRANLERTYADLRTRVVHMWNDDDDPLQGAIIPGWFRKDLMAALLVPPVTKPLYLVLYDVEEGWHSDFRRERQRHRAARSARSDRAKLFPQVKGWSKPAAQPPETIRKDHDTSLQTLEEIHQYVQFIYRQHVYKAARSDGTEAEVPARLIIFDGGAHAFLTESHKVNIVTHLLDGTIEGGGKEEAGVKEVTVKELKHGDAVLFHRRSERDVVRTVADEELAAGVRGTSSLWRVALTRYVEREHVTPRQLWERLKTGGCSVSLPTVREWLNDADRIAPREYTEHVPIIAAVTKDEMLTNQLTTVLHAIHTVFSAHQKASHRIARQVLRRAVEVLREENRQSSLIEIESNIVLVRVAEIDNSMTQTRVSIVNRLQEPEQ